MQEGAKDPDQDVLTGARAPWVKHRRKETSVQVLEKRRAAQDGGTSRAAWTMQTKVEGGRSFAIPIVANLGSFVKFVKNHHSRQVYPLDGYTTPRPRPRGRPPPSLACCPAVSKAPPGERRSAFPGHSTSCRFRRVGRPVRSRERAQDGEVGR
jgi:hypothetical protein